MMRVPEGERSGLLNDVSTYGLEVRDKALASQVRSDQFVSLIDPVMVNGKYRLRMKRDGFFRQIERM